MIVLDASVAVELVRDTPTGEAAAERVRARQGLHVPHLLLVEGASALRKFLAKGMISEARANRALNRLMLLPAARHDHDPLLPRVWQLRDNLTPYDAVYVALAEYLGATLLTTDQRLAQAPGHRARVEVLAA